MNFFKELFLQTKPHEIPLYSISNREIIKFNIRDTEYGYSPVPSPSDFKYIGQGKKRKMELFLRQWPFVLLLREIKNKIKSNHVYIFTNPLHFSSQPEKLDDSPRKTRICTIETGIIFSNILKVILNANKYWHLLKP